MTERIPKLIEYFKLIDYFKRNVAQLNLVRDLLAKKDHYFYPAAAILVDHVVESLLYQFVRQEAIADMKSNKHGAGLAKKVLEGGFVGKLQFAQKFGLIKEDAIKKSIEILHEKVRNAVQHRNSVIVDWPKETIHPLTVLYHEIACKLLQDSAVALKFLPLIGLQKPLRVNLNRILAKHMCELFTLVEQALGYIASEVSLQTEKEVVKFAIDKFLSAVDEQDLLCEKAPPYFSGADLANVFKKNRKSFYRKDVISSWMRQHDKVAAAENPHIALQEYFAFERSENAVIVFAILEVVPRLQRKI